MKILRLSFRNLNSLAGDWSIDFQDPAFRDGLFLLTGPTGSGKTTVLDAITLALYGRTARVEVTGSRNEVLTRNAGDCFAEVVFQTRDGAYTARWAQVRPKGRGRNRGGWGDLQPVRMSLRDASGTELSGHRIEDTKRLIARTVGLTYDQFSRTVLLAQGSFDKFLTATGNERAELLEQATGTEIYSRIGQRVFREKQKADALVEALENQGKGLQPMSEEQRDATRADLVSARAIETGLAPITQALAREKAWLVAAAALADRAASLEDSARALAARKAAFTAEAVRLDQAEKALPLREDHATLRAARGASQTADRDVDARATALADARGALPAAETAAGDAKRAAAAAQAAFDAEQPRIAQARSLLSRCQALEATLLGKRSALRNAETALRSLEEQRATAQTKRAQAQRRIASLETQTDPFAGELADANHAIHAAEADVKAAGAARDTADEALRVAEPTLLEAIQAARKSQLLAGKVRDLAEERAKLHDGDRCPLCLQTFHAIEQALPDFDEESARLARCERALEDARHKAAAAQDALSRAQDTLSAAQRKTADLQRKSSDFRTRHAADMAAARSMDEAQAAAATDAEAKLPGKRAALETCRSEAAAAESDLQAARDALGALGIADVERHAAAIQRKRSAAAEASTQKAAALRAAQNAVATAEDELRKARATQADARDALREAERVFRARLAVDGFADEAAWSSALWTDADLRRARSEREILRKDETSLAALRTAWKQDDTALRASPDRSERALADVDGELADAEVRRSAAHDDAIRLQGDLDHDDRLRQNLGTLLRRLEEARLMATRWNSLNRWFGGMGGDNFRRYAQCLTLQELVEKANPHLSRMSNGRYRLVWTLEDMEAASRPESDLLLPLVRDAAQANEKRPLANLSGGERFQVSLSLALGLSEMNAEGVSIESLFLDEGFGTLDGEALERAIDTLEAVQRAGCLLGIISHIEDVARRFQHTRIVVERRGGGHSVLSGIGVRRPRPAPSGASPREEG